MPKRDDIRKVLIIGSGPIIIGQACEFDYSGTQACKALREEGFKVVLLNSNPATIMTDPDLADRTYIEPVTPETIEKILQREAELGDPIDAVLPTLGGQTGLNCAVETADRQILQRFDVQMIGATHQSINKAENPCQGRLYYLRYALDRYIGHALAATDRTTHQASQQPLRTTPPGRPCASASAG